MKKKYFIFLPFLLTLLSGVLVSCEEVEEEGYYHNWRERNESFIDSLQSLNPVFVTTEEKALAMPIGELFYIQVHSASSINTPQYVYCKKIVANPEGGRPMYTEAVKAFYYGTLITGDRFDGNFAGYSALDRGELLPDEKAPTEFDSPGEFSVKGVIAGWIEALQYMREGERWMLYVPYPCAYGTGDYGNIAGYSALTFDLQLVEIIK